MSPVAEPLARRYDAVRPHLTERQRRVWLGAEARELGSAGVQVVADAVGVSPDTVRRGRKSWMTRSRWRWAAPAFPAGAASVPGSWIRAWPTRYQPKGSPVRVNVHDFPGDAEGKAIPYGVCDIGANAGWVSVGTDHETAAFAVSTLRSWWSTIGKSAYPGAGRLLITADSGGSNGSRRRAWKTGLAALATETGLEISVCHLPPGTSSRVGDWRGGFSRW